MQLSNHQQIRPEPIVEIPVRIQVSKSIQLRVINDLLEIVRDSLGVVVSAIWVHVGFPVVDVLLLDNATQQKKKKKKKLKKRHE